MKNVSSEAQNNMQEYKTIFPIGNQMPKEYSQYFKGQAYLNMLTTEGVTVMNVTFEPSCRNNWHIHHGGGQILMAISGKGYFQLEGKEVQILNPGDIVQIPVDVKHWHGASRNSMFTHLAIEIPADNYSTEWLDQVSDEDYLTIEL